MCQPDQVYYANVSENRLSFTVNFNVYINEEWCSDFYSAIPAHTTEGPAIYIPFIQNLDDPAEWQNSHVSVEVNYDGNPPDQPLPKLFVVAIGEDFYASTSSDGTDYQPVTMYAGAFINVQTRGIVALEEDGIWIAGAIDDGSGEIGHQA